MSSPLKKTYNIVVNKTSVLPLLKWQTKQQREWHDLASKSGEDKRMLDREHVRMLARKDEWSGRREEARKEDSARREDSRAQLCQSYLESGRCREGRRCSYAHSMEAVRRGRRDERNTDMRNSGKFKEAPKTETVEALKKKLAVLEEVIKARGIKDREMGDRSKSLGLGFSSQEMKAAGTKDLVPGDRKTAEWILEKRKVRSMSAVRSTGRSKSTARSSGRDITHR